MDQHVDLAADLADLFGDGRHGLGVEQVDAVVVGGAAGRFDRLDRGQRGVAPLDAGQLLLDHRRCGAFSRRLEALEDRALEAVAVGGERGEVGIGAVGLGRQIEQVEDAAEARGEVADDGRHDAAGCAGDDEHRVVAKLDAGGRLGHRPRLEGDGEALVVVVAHLDDSGVAQGFVDEYVGECRCLAAGSEVDRLHERVGAFPLERLGDPDDAAAHRCDGTGVVVAVPSAESGGGDEEGPRFSHGLVEMAQGAEQQLDPESQGLLPLRPGPCRRAAPRGRAPEASRCPGPLVASPRVDAFEELVGLGGVVDGQHVGSERFELLDQCGADAALVEHDQDPAAFAEVDPGREQWSRSGRSTLTASRRGIAADASSSP